MWRNNLDNQFYKFTRKAHRDMLARVHTMTIAIVRVIDPIALIRLNVADRFVDLVCFVNLSIFLTIDLPRYSELV